MMVRLKFGPYLSVLMQLLSVTCASAAYGEMTVEGGSFDSRGPHMYSAIHRNQA